MKGCVWFDKVWGRVYNGHTHTHMDKIFLIIDTANGRWYHIYIDIDLKCLSPGNIEFDTYARSFCGDINMMMPCFDNSVRKAPYFQIDNYIHVQH